MIAQHIVGAEKLFRTRRGGTLRDLRAATVYALLMLVLHAGGMAVAQSTGAAEGEPGGETTFTVAVKPIAAFGVAGGLPGYQAASALASVQYRWAGAALRAGYGTVGVQASLDLRGYPPVPVPVPVYGALGLNVYGLGVGIHAAVGAHVPITVRWRLDVEAGVAWAPFETGRSVAPHLLLGVSYAIPFDASTLSSGSVGRDLDPRAEDVSTGDPTGEACRGDREPSPESVDRAVARTVQSFLEEAQAGYGSVYTDLRYTYAITDTTYAGTVATAEVTYSGSVREIATGERVSTEGVATVDLVWTGCEWSAAGFSY